jgi:hypothetical protein
MTRTGAWAAAAVVIALAPGAASPQEEAEGYVNAVAYQALPAGVALRVRALDNSEHNLRIKDDFERRLAAKGFRVGEPAALILTIETRDEIGSWVDKGRRTILELDAHGGREGGERAQARVNLYDSVRGGVLNEGEGGTAVTSPSQFTIEVTVDEAASGRRVWQAWTVANLKFTDQAALARAMVPAMVQDFGQSVNRKPFKIR